MGPILRATSEGSQSSLTELETCAQALDPRGLVTQAQVWMTPKSACSFTLGPCLTTLESRGTTKTGSWAAEMGVGARGEVGVRRA